MISVGGGVVDDGGGGGGCTCRAYYPDSDLRLVRTDDCWGVGLVGIVSVSESGLGFGYGRDDVGVGVGEMRSGFLSVWILEFGYSYLS